MRIIKENTVEYPSLYTTIVSNNKKNLRKSFVEENTDNNRSEYNELFDALYTYGRKVRETNDINAITDYLKTSLKKFINVEEISLFNSADKSNEPFSLLPSTSKTTLNLIKTIFEDGLLEKILNRGILSIIPTRNRNSNQYNYYLIFPIVDLDRSNQYFLSIKTKESNFETGTYNRKVLQSFIQVFIPRIEYLLQKQDLNQTYNELQLYQSKVSNDYKLSAVGEMTNTFLDQILSPMQVILSCVEILDHEGSADEHLINSMRSQIKKVNSITNKISKFSSKENQEASIVPCLINNFITEFHDLIKDSLDDNNFEVILDLEKEIPPILSTPNSLHQILTNAFSLMIDMKEVGGLYLHTKYVNNSVTIRFLSTNNKIFLKQNGRGLNNNINIMMLESLMKKHEGKANFTSSKDEGSSLELIFPLKRKLLK